mmetsp:Transcript_33936/g.95486  ORF Transcript_33936/g.95486 Transcript_33936/m.95486 type:complete len:346 (-) Transcript_33936:204-1241(-)
MDVEGSPATAAMGRPAGYSAAGAASGPGAAFWLFFFLLFLLLGRSMTCPFGPMSGIPPFPPMPKRLDVPASAPARSPFFFFLSFFLPSAPGSNEIAMSSSRRPMPLRLPLPGLSCRFPSRPASCRSRPSASRRCCGSSTPFFPCLRFPLGRAPSSSRLAAALAAAWARARRSSRARSSFMRAASSSACRWARVAARRWSSSFTSYSHRSDLLAWRAAAASSSIFVNSSKTALPAQSKKKRPSSRSGVPGALTCSPSLSCPPSLSLAALSFAPLSFSLSLSLSLAPRPALLPLRPFSSTASLLAGAAWRLAWPLSAHCRATYPAIPSFQRRSCMKSLAIHCISCSR